MDRALLVSKIEAAKADITAAEEDLEQLIRAMRVKSRAEKTTITEALEAAFKKLRAARIQLDELEALLLGSPSEP